MIMKNNKFKGVDSIMNELIFLTYSNNITIPVLILVLVLVICIILMTFFMLRYNALKTLLLIQYNTNNTNYHSLNLNNNFFNISDTSEIQGKVFIRDIRILRKQLVFDVYLYENYKNLKFKSNEKIKVIQKNPRYYNVIIKNSSLFY